MVNTYQRIFIAISIVFAAAFGRFFIGCKKRYKPGKKGARKQTLSKWLETPSGCGFTGCCKSGVKKVRAIKKVGSVARYDWNSLKQEYIAGDYKGLREFAEMKGIPYAGAYKRATTGWTDEKKQKQAKKQAKIAEGIFRREVLREIDRNAKQLELSDALMAKVIAVAEYISPKDKNAAYHLQALIAAQEKLQKVQRIGEGAAKPVDNGVMLDILELLNNSATGRLPSPPTNGKGDGNE